LLFYSFSPDSNFQKKNKKEKKIKRKKLAYYGWYIFFRRNGIKRGLYER